MKIKYNTLYEPWIDVIDDNNESLSIGIKELLARAHELKEIIDPSPLVQYGLYRMLVAIVMDAWSIKTVGDVATLLERQQFDTTTMKAYFNKWGGRFDLFSTEHPFYQSPDDGKEHKEKSIVELFHQFPIGNNAIHFFHVPTEAHAMVPAVCAKGLCTISPFTPQGGAGYSPSINGTPPWYIIVKGENLFETIVLNTCGLELAENSGSGTACWRIDDPVEPKKEVSEASTLEGLTWRPRYVRLFPGEGGTCTYSGLESDVLVRNIYFDYGLKFQGTWRDPHVSYIYAKKNVFGLSPEGGKALWRDTGPIAFLTRDDDTGNKKVKFDRPAVVTQFIQLQQRRELSKSRPVLLEVFGVRMKQKKSFEWQRETLSIPFDLVIRKESGTLVQRAINTAERVNNAINAAIKVMYPRSGEGNSDAFDRFKERAGFQYWTALEPRFKQEYLWKIVDSGLDKDAELDSIQEGWKKAVASVGKNVLDGVLGQLDTDANLLRKQVLAENEYFKRTYNLLHVPQQKTEKMKT